VASETAVGGEGWGPGADRAVPMFASLRVPNFRLYFVGQTLSGVGSWFHALALALLALDLGGGAAALGIVVALGWLPLLLLGSWAGVALDRRDPRRVLLATNAANTALAGALALLAATGHITSWWLGAFSLAFGMVLPFDRPAMALMPVELVEPGLVSNALALNSVTLSAARLLGPALGGVTFALAGPAWCFTVNGLSYLVVLASLLALDRAALFARPRTTPARRQVREGFAYLAGHARLRGVLLTNVLVGLLAMNSLVVITAMVQIQFGGGGLAVGVAHAANAAGALVAGAVVGAVLARLSRRLELVCLALGLALAANAAAPTLVAFVALGPPLGAALVAYQSAVFDACHRLARPEMLGRMMSLATVGMQGTTPIGSVIVGVAIDHWSPRAALALGAAASGAGACLLAWAAHARAPQLEGAAWGS
jgi:MFS family permease